jgi:pimeloyl-ACP methyl ester carboxylesterase
VRIIGPSLPGWGWSEAAPDSSPKKWAGTDAVELLQAVNASEPVHLFGASLGSIYAAELISAASPIADRFENVMLYVAIAPKTEAFDPLNGSDLNVFSQLHRFPTAARLLDKFVIIPLLKSLVGGDVARSLNLWEGLWRCTDDIKGDRSLFAPDLTSKRRVFVVSGSKDTAAPPANQKKLVELIPGSVLLAYEGGHDESIKNPTIMQEHLSMLIQ